MKKRYIGIAGLGLVLALGTQQVHAQQGFGTDKPAKSAAVDIQSSKRGLLIPRVDLVSTVNGTTPINTPEQSLMVYNQATTTKGANDVTPGYYYWDTNRWVRFAQQGDITAINLGGDVTGPINATVVGAIQGTPVSDVNPTANQVLMFDDVAGEWKAVILTETSINSSKGITGTGITVTGESNGANATLKDVALAITPGKPNQVMVTNTTGDGTTWVEQSTIAPATTHTLTKEANTNGNTLVSTVNGVTESVSIIENVTNTVTGTTIQTTVNGVVSNAVDIKDAIQAGQKITKVVDGLNTTVTSSVNPADGNTTEYQVNVSKEAIQAEQKTTVVAAGTGIAVVPTSADNVTTYTVSADASTIVLAGDVTGHAGANTISELQGTEVAASGSKTEGQALVYQGGKWVPGTPKVNATDIKETKNLTAAGGDAATIEVVSGGTNAVLVETSLRVKSESITSSEIKNGTILPEDIAKAGNNQVLVTNGSGIPEWKNKAKVAPQFFYMPAVIFNTKTTGTNLTRDLYQDYVNQFTTASGTSYNIAHGANQGSLPYNGGVISSSGAPAVMDVFDRGELYYYITYYDTNVFADISINENGVLKYSIIGTATPASYMNIVFVIK
ncbi:hypothetical protein ACKUSY_04580 [Myroides odoratus]